MWQLKNTFRNFIKKIVNICEILMIINTYSYVIVKYLFNYSIMKLEGSWNYILMFSFSKKLII